MSHDIPDVVVERRRLFGSAGAALALAGTSSAAAAIPLVRTPLWPVTRARFALQADARIPYSSDNVYVIPYAGAAVFNDGGFTLNDDYTITVAQTGLYLMFLSFDWQEASGSQAGQVGLRINGICHSTPDSPPGKFAPGKLTIVKTKNDRLGQYDVSPTNTARTARWQGHWRSLYVGKKEVVSVDVVLQDLGVVTLGDMAVASHSGISDATMGDDATPLILHAKVIAPDVVRVSIYNSSADNKVMIPAGTLKVLAMSAQSTMGDTSHGRSMLGTATEVLNAGDIIYGTFKSQIGGDTMLASANTFLQIERWG